jgi:hypothetical protein
MITSVTSDLFEAELGKAKSDTKAEFVKSVDTNFIEQEHDEFEIAMLDFSGCKGPFMLPYEFRAKEIDEHQQEESIAEPSSAEEEHQGEEAKDLENKEDKTLENYQHAEQDNVHTKSISGKKVTIDDNALPKLIMPKGPETEVSNVNGRKTKLAPRSKPTVKQLLDKYSARNANNIFSRLRGNKHPFSPSRHGGHVRWREKSYNQQPYFPMARTYWSCAPPTYPQFPPWGVIPWAPYLTSPASSFEAEFIPLRPMFRPHFHEKKARFTHEARSRAAIVIRGSRSHAHNLGGKKYIVDRKLAWVPVRSAGTKASSTIVSQPAKSSNVSDVNHGVKSGETKVADIGGGVQQQQHGSGRVEKDAILELNGKGSNSHAENTFRRDGSMDGCTNSITAKNIGLHAALGPDVHSRSTKKVIPASPSDLVAASADICLNRTRKFELRGPSNYRKVFSPKYGFVPKATVCPYRPGSSDVDEVGCDSVQRKVACTEGKHVNNIYAYPQKK